MILTGAFLIKEGVSFEEDLSDIENNAVKESLQDHLLQQTGFLSKRSPGKYCGIFNLFFRPQRIKALIASEINSIH